MKRPRRETISSLGRSPGRQTHRLPGAGTGAPPPSAPPAPEGGRGWLSAALFDNVGLKALSFVLAVTVYLLINTDRDREITARVGVTYRVPDSQVVVSDLIDEVRITVRGTWRHLRRFDEREVDRIDVDLTKVEGGQIELTPSMVSLPKGLTLTSIRPRTVRVAFERKVEKTIEVAPTIVGRPAHGFVVAEVESAPASVRLRGPEGVLGRLSTVGTTEIRVDGRSESYATPASILTPDGVEVVPTSEVSVSIKLEEQLVTRRIERVPVRVSGDGASRLVVEPTEVVVVLTGAMLAVEHLVRDGVSAVVAVKASDVARKQRVAVVLDPLPPGIAVELTPTSVELRPKRSPPP